MDISDLAKFCQYIDISSHQYTLGGYGHRILEISKDAEDAASNLILGLGRLIRIRGGAYGNGISAPRLAFQLLTENFGGVDFDEDARLEISTCILAKKLVGRPCVTVCAGMAAAPVGVQCPPERKPRDINLIE